MGEPKKKVYETPSFIKVGDLSAEQIDWLNDSARAQGAVKSGTKSNALALPVVLIVVGVFASLFALVLLTGKGRSRPIAAVVSVLLGPAGLYFGIKMWRQRAACALEEFELMTPAYNFHSNGRSTLTAWKLGLCRDITFTHHLRNGIYMSTSMSLDFGPFNKLEFHESLNGGQRAAPLSNTTFAHYNQLVLGARSALANDSYDELAGAHIVSSMAESRSTGASLGSSVE